MFGWYTIPALSTSCDATGWETSVKAAAVNAGVDLSRFDYLVYVHPMVSVRLRGPRTRQRLGRVAQHLRRRNGPGNHRRA